MDKEGSKKDSKNAFAAFASGEGKTEQRTIDIASPPKDFFSGITTSKVVSVAADIQEYEKAAHADDIINFLNPFMNSLDSKTKKWDSMEEFVGTFKEYVRTHEKEKRGLMDVMGLKKMVFPYTSIDLPSMYMLHFNNLDETDPELLVHSQNPKVLQLSTFLDRHDSNTDIVGHFIWSSVDQIVVHLSETSLNPFPLCHGCKKQFGIKVCAKCGIGRYCSKECQLIDWNRRGPMAHKIVCPDYAQYVNTDHLLVFDY